MGKHKKHKKDKKEKKESRRKSSGRKSEERKNRGRKGHSRSRRGDGASSPGPLSPDRGPVAPDELNNPGLALMVLKVMLKEHPALSGELVPLLEALDADQVVDLTNIGNDAVRLKLSAFLRALDVNEMRKEVFVRHKQTPPAVPRFRSVIEAATAAHEGKQAKEEGTPGGQSAEEKQEAGGRGGEEEEPAPAKRAATGAKPLGPIGPAKLPSEVTGDDAGAEEGVEGDEDEDEIGPQPSWMRQARQPTAQAVAAAELRRKRERQGDEDDGQPKRESWMTELPDDRMGAVGAVWGKNKTKFTSTDVKQDQSWTALPGDKAAAPAPSADKGEGTRKGKGKGKASKVGANPVQEEAIAAQDAKARSLIDRFKEKRGADSMLDEHQEKRRRVAGTKAGERKPFDRERDVLGMGVGSEATAEKYKGRGNTLSSRFAAPKASSSFL